VIFEKVILKTAVKENENGADTRKHAGFLIFWARNPGTARVSTGNSKALSDFSRMRRFGTRNCPF
jgi:hypothetical protein